MKLPRWLVISMLSSSVLAVLAAAGWWWVTWPERTAREFVDLLGSGRRDNARRMFHDGTECTRRRNWFFESYVPIDWSSVALRPESRTWNDRLSARQVFQTSLGWTLVVEHGAVDLANIDMTRLPYSR
jgi:hypothetical protein